MASILRSSKFVRYFAGFARSIVFNTTRESEKNFLQQSQCFCNNLSQGLTTAVPRPDHSLDRSLKRLDQDVRRSGRISRRDIEEVLEEIRQHRSATSSQSLLVIRCCGNLVPEELPEVRTALVQEIWRTLNNLNVPMDISHYNALLRVYLENEHPFSPTEFLADLETKGVEPNRVTYQRLISRYCQDGDIEGATRILEFMREKQLPVNENVFNALIMGHSQSDDMESAVGILSVMQQAGLEPSADTYTTLLCGYARKGDIDSIQTTLDTCERKEIYLLDKDIFDVIHALAVNGHGAFVDPLISRLRKSVGYNQDAVNLILRLTNKGYEDVAFKILKTMPRSTRPNGDLSDTGNFFIRQLIKAKRPVETILKLCNELQETELNTKALLIAIEAGLSQGNVDLVMPLLSEAKKIDLPIRQHYFWPLICAAGKENDTDKVLNILQRMQEEFQIQPTGETVRDYAIPNIKEKNPEKLITLLKNVGVSVSTASVSIVFNELANGNLKGAAETASNYKAYYSPGLLRRVLVQALAKSNDFDSYIKLVRQIYEGLSRLENLPAKQKLEQQLEEEEAINNTDDLAVAVSNDDNQSATAMNNAEILGQIIFDIAVYFRNDRTVVLEKVLGGLVEQGLAISNKQAAKIQDKLGSELTTEISSFLGKLTAGDLEPVPIEQADKKRNSGINQMTPTQIERIIEQVEAKGESAKGLKRFLLSACFKSKDLNKSEEIVAKLENEGYVLTSGVYAQLIDLYCHHEKLDSVIATYDKIKQKEPDFLLDNMKTIKVATLLVANDKFDNAIRFLDANKKETLSEEEQSFNYSTTCWRLLNSLADKGKAEDLQKIFNVLEVGNYIDINNILLGPLIKVHLVNNDLVKAMETFEDISNKYRSTPWKNELACRLIQAEDANNLQKLTDLSTNIHGEVNSLYDLVFSFVECGRIRQARKILETPGLRTRYQRINFACERYRQEGMIQPLEGLVEATKDLNHIDRGDIYYNLLLSYCKDDEASKALGLWTKMQEENIAPSDAFLIKLGNFLESKGLEVPFVIPTTIASLPQIKKSTGQQQEIKNQIELKEHNSLKKSTSFSKTGAQFTTSETMANFKQALKKGDVDGVLEAKKKFIENDKLNVTDQSLLIELLLKSDRYQEATKTVLEMLSQSLHPIPRIFRFYLNKIASQGDVTSIEQIGQHLNAETKKLVSYDNRLCHANITAGKAEEYLNQLENDLDEAKTEKELAAVGEKFPRGGAVGILEKHPEMCDRFEQIAEKYAARGVLSPINVLWMHHFASDNTEAHKRIWDKYLATAPRLMFQRVVHLARDQQNENLIEKLIDVLKTTKVSEGAIGNAYSCLLDVLVAKGKFNECLVMLDTAIKDICLENINRTALMRVKDGIEKSGKVFPHKIPEKNAKFPGPSSSSSSSSDDEPKK